MNIQNQVSQIIHNNNITSHEELVKILQSKYYLKIYEKDNFYSLFYTNSTLQNFENEDWVKDCIGVIFEKNTNIVKAFTQTMAKEIIYENDNSFQNFNLNFANSFYTTYKPGARIALWYDINSNTWKKSTSKRIDAYECFWGNNTKSFGEMFDEAARICNLDSANLDINSCYTFILTHPDNNQIIKTNTPTLTYICSFNLNKLDVGNYLQYNNLNISNYTGEVQNSFKCNSIEELKNIFETQEIKTNYCPGIVITDGYNRYKILTYYYNCATLMMNNMNRVSYLKIRQDKKQISTILSLNPSLNEIFMNIEKTIYKVAIKMFSLYHSHFVKKRTDKNVQIEKPYFVFIHKIHEIYKKNKKDNQNFVIRKNLVIKYLNSLDVGLIEKLITTYENENKESETTESGMMVN